MTLKPKYDEEIYCLDKEFNNLLSKIKSLGIFDDTTIIIFGDHGESFDHQALFHGFRLYQSEVKVPFIIKSPLIAVSPQNNASLLDITPTLVDYFKLEVGAPIKFDGLNLNKIGNNPNRVLYMETAGPYYDKGNSNGYGLVLNDFKFINDGRSFELYNLKTDPKEEENLIKMITPQDIKKLADLLKAREN